MRHDSSVPCHHRIDPAGLSATLRRLDGRTDIKRPPEVGVAEHVAQALSRVITEGELPPGTQLSEELLCAALGVSRNTLREAFRLLAHDGLLVHHRHRGVFVAELDEADLTDLYRLRRVLECGGLRALGDVPPQLVALLEDDVRAAESAALDGRWREVGTANMDFHQHLLSRAGSRRIAEIGRRVLAETRLAFLGIRDTAALHEPYIRRNRRLLELLKAGRVDEAADELETYLHDSEQQLLAAIRRDRGFAGPCHLAGDSAASAVTCNSDG